MAEVLLHPREVERRTGLSRSELDRLEEKRSSRNRFAGCPARRPTKPGWATTTRPRRRRLSEGREAKRTREVLDRERSRRLDRDLIVTWRTQQDVEVAPEVRDGFAERAVARDKEQRRRARHRIDPTA